ncbi:MAG: hypothetical protein ABFR62_01535 [Bacteroidota bacterium]
MDKKQKIIQIYAVVICVAAVITMLISTAGLVSALIDRNDPIHAWRNDQKLASFENFKMDALKSTLKDQAYIPDDATLHKMYESAREDKIMSVEHHVKRSIIVNSLIITIAVILFVSHWVLIRRVGKTEELNVSSA